MRHLPGSVLVLAALLASMAASIRIVQSNGEGWATLNIRQLNDALRADGHDVVLSAPADNQSGTGKRNQSTI